jgi:hypothetical protein
MRPQCHALQHKSSFQLNALHHLQLYLQSAADAAQGFGSTVLE